MSVSVEQQREKALVKLFRDPRTPAAHDPVRVVEPQSSPMNSMAAYSIFPVCLQRRLCTVQLKGRLKRSPNIFALIA